jgi:cytochrome c-type biogenesis protein CcmH/NrfG
MNKLTLGLLGALLATSPLQADTPVVPQPTNVAGETAPDPAAQELRGVMTADDAAQDEVNGWIHENDALTTVTNKAELNELLNKRIAARFDLVRQDYEKFLRNHPESARGYLAYGSFLNDIGDEDGAKTQYENSRQLDPKNPAVWNNLANYYSEHNQVTNAFADYTEAIRLKPDEPVYYQNFATTVYLFRSDARAFYHLDEPQVFDKALGLYRQAMQLSPNNFVLATDYAESYYGIRPLRTNDTLAAWTNAMGIAHTDAERQGVELHLARVKMAAGFFNEARTHLAVVTNAAFLDLKTQLTRNLAEREYAATNPVPVIATNHPAVTATNAVPATTPPPVLSPKFNTTTPPVPLDESKAAGLLVMPPPGGQTPR